LARIEIETRIAAPVAMCFDLARDLDLHASSMQRHGERAVAGVTTGLIGAGEEVTWRANHFGLWHQHRSRIVDFAPPHYFRDVMVAGRFESFEHDHYFEQDGQGTLMRDVLSFRSPCGWLGRAVDSLVLRRYLRRLLERRNEAIQCAAEEAGYKAVRGEDPGSTRSSLNTRHVREALSRVIAVLDEVNSPWVQPLRLLRSRLAMPSKASAAAAELRSLFGGMGSLNDILIDERNGNLSPERDARALSRELDRRLDTLFLEVDSCERGSWVRAWRILKARLAPHGPPPRILNAFHDDLPL